MYLKVENWKFQRKKTRLNNKRGTATPLYVVVAEFVGELLELECLTKP